MLKRTSLLSLAALIVLFPDFDTHVVDADGEQLN